MHVLSFICDPHQSGKTPHKFHDAEKCSTFLGQSNCTKFVKKLKMYQNNTYVTWGNFAIASLSAIFNASELDFGVALDPGGFCKENGLAGFIILVTQQPEFLMATKRQPFVIWIAGL